MNTTVSGFCPMIEDNNVKYSSRLHGITVESRLFGLRLHEIQIQRIHFQSKIYVFIAFSTHIMAVGPIFYMSESPKV